MRKASTTKRRNGTERRRSSATPAMIDAAAIQRANQIAAWFSGDGSLVEGGDELTIIEKDLFRREAIKLAVAALQCLDAEEIQLIAATLIHQHKLLDGETRHPLHDMVRA